MAIPSSDTRQSPCPRGFATPWCQLFIVMAVPVLLLLIVISFSR
jgi:hypothetical protein